MIDRRLISNFDWSLFIIPAVISIIGIMTIYSATRPVIGGVHSTFYMRQVYWLIVGISAFIITISIDYRWYIKFSYPLFVLSTALLILVLFTGKEGLGARRWIDLGIISFQPSEFFKLSLILVLSRYLSGRDNPLSLKDILMIFLIFITIPTFLILKQPDLGTAIMLLFICISMILTAGIRRKILLIILIVSLISMPVAGKMIWKGLKDYQRQRIVAFINPQADPQGVGYHIKQSKISIGSGGLLGKGYLKGTQGPYRFLPENHTDFIFSIFAEEWGFVGSVILFILYLYLIWRGFETARSSRDREGCFLCVGVTYMLALYFFINVGMTLGLLPVVGVPLPLMSYGGTALVSNFIAIGLLENVMMRRFADYYV